MIVMLLTGCATTLTERAAKQLEDAERFADKHAKALREASFIWSEYPLESYHD